MLSSTSKKKSSSAQLLFASISGEADSNPSARQQRDLSATRAQHVTLLPIGYHPVDETNVQLIIQAMTRVTAAPTKAQVGVNPIDDSEPRFGAQYSKDIGRYDQRIIVRESAGPERYLAEAATGTTTSRLPPVLTAEEKALQAEQKRLEAEALAMAAVLEKNIYKKPEDTIQAMLGKLVARMWQDGVKYVNTKLGRAPTATKSASPTGAPASPFKPVSSGPVSIPIH